MILEFLIGTCAFAARTNTVNQSMPDPPKQPPGYIRSGGVNRAKLRLEAAALEEGNQKKDLRFRMEDFGPGWTVVAITVEGAMAPGGVYRVLVGEDGKSYGARGELNFAEFVRRQGWLSSPPEAKEYQNFVNWALFDGAAVFRNHPTLRLSEESLEFRTHRWFPPGSSDTPVFIRVGAKGGVEIR